MIRRLLHRSTWLLAAAAFALPAAATPPDVVQRCSACHDLASDGKRAWGPRLGGIVDGPVGADPDYRYGSYLQARRTAGATWSEAALRDWLDDSKAVARAADARTRMPAQRLTDDEVDAVIAYLRTLGPPPDGSAELQRAAGASDGGLVYEGTVHRRGTGGSPLFRYERRVLDLDGTVRSTHLTRALSGEPVVLHEAEHTPRYRLLAFREVHAQTGLVGELAVDADGTATYRTTVDGVTRTRSEPAGDPLHVGPTLFGYVLENWDSLLAGSTLPVRFAVLERRRSYRFMLRTVPGDAGTVTVEMVPINPLVALGVPTSRLRFDLDGNILTYAGLVPPLHEVDGRLERLDAAVTYAHAGPRYR